MLLGERFMEPSKLIDMILNQCGHASGKMKIPIDKIHAKHDVVHAKHAKHAKHAVRHPDCNK